MPANRSSETRVDHRLRDLFVRSLPALILLCGALVLAGPQLKRVVEHYIAISAYVDERRIETTLAPLFTVEVAHWHDDIVRWAAEYGLDPNLVATIIQIESCGDPAAISSAGAQGLMQVMPQYFSTTDNPLDPNTNIRRGLDILTECLYSPYNTQRDIGMAFACYNGGPSVFVGAWERWPQQSRDYYIWGTNIYEDAKNNAAQSDTLDQWLLYGGDTLCANARQSLGLVVAP
jgi:soluble lytic murein transglycosylase-like protein